jgi:hypothetical protein
LTYTREWERAGVCTSVRVWARLCQCISVHSTGSGRAGGERGGGSCGVG